MNCTTIVDGFEKAIASTKLFRVSIMGDSGTLAKKSAPTPKKKWVQNVKTVSTYPPKDVFTKDAQTIAHVMASKKVSPKGIGSGIRMIQYFVNRAGKGLSPSRKKELEKAKKVLQAKLRNRLLRT